MSLRPTLLLYSARGNRYQNRVMCYAHRRQARFHMKMKPYAKTPLVNKQPEEYKNTQDWRSGLDWYYRLKHKGHYRHWPWANWNDDPIRHHSDLTVRRTLSIKHTGANEGMPEWNYYAEVGQEYNTPSHFPATYVAPFIYQYTARIWSRENIVDYITQLQEECNVKTIRDVVERAEELKEWSEYHSERIPRGLVQHLLLVCEDVLLYNEKKAFRAQQHKNGVLRTREMEQYYALPHLRGVAMPEKLAQPSGCYPYGKYLYREYNIKIHPLQVPDCYYKQNFYPN